MRLRVEEPHVKVITRDSCAWVLGIESHESFATDWMAGRAFWRGVDAFGTPVVIKLADIVGIALWDEDRIAYAMAESAEERHRDLLDGDG